MKQHEAVIKTMEENGGFATLGQLNQAVLKVRNVEWKTKTPFASIRRIVQDKRFFFKIKPGLWALLSYKSKLPQNILPVGSVPKQEQELYNHSYYQGLLVEIGRMKQYETFVPNQVELIGFFDKTLAKLVRLQVVMSLDMTVLLRKADRQCVSIYHSENAKRAF